MNLTEKSQDNLAFMIDGLAEKLQVVNRSIMNPEDYDLSAYDDVKSLYEMIINKGSLSVSEIQAIVEELGKYRKK